MIWVDKMNVTILASSGGFSFDYLLCAIKKDLVNCNVLKIITDRECRTEFVAKKHNIKIERIETTLLESREEYSKKLLNSIPINTDLVVISLRRLISGRILEEFKDRIINTHPSLLPAYPGYGAIRNLLKEGKSLFGGCSCHLVNEKADDGPVIIQSVISIDSNANEKVWALKAWNHQKHNMCQAIQFFSENRVNIFNNKVVIKNASYGFFPTNPKIEIDFSSLDSEFKIEY
jgi:phosphoribosylglycinamide formyltransferase-1